MFYEARMFSSKIELLCVLYVFYLYPTSVKAPFQTSALAHS